MVDYIALVRGRLLDPGGPVLSLLGGDRVWPSDLPEFNPVTLTGFRPADGPGIAIAMEGGTAHQEIPIQTARIKIRICGDANQFVRVNEVYRAVHEWLHGINLVSVGGDGFIIACQAASLATDFTDPDVAWATSISFFSITARERSVN